MYTLTKLSLLYVIAKKAEVPGEGPSIEVSLDDVEDFITRVVPIQTGVVANESPAQVYDEVVTAVKQINYYARRFHKKEGCLELKDNKIIVKDKECLDIAKRLFDRSKERARTSKTLMAAYALATLSATI